MIISGPKVIEAKVRLRGSFSFLAEPFSSFCLLSHLLARTRRLRSRVVGSPRFSASV